MKILNYKIMHADDFFFVFSFAEGGCGSVSLLLLGDVADWSVGASPAG